MDAATLHRIVPSADLDRCAALVPGYNWFCSTAAVNTVARCAMALAMVAEESASFHALEEYASGAEYNWRTDLGNTQPGDGERFKGRSLIQITGRNNYGRVSVWAHHRGLVPTDRYFLDHPAELANMRYAWVGPAQYWLGDHNHGYGSINAAADAHDIVAATYMVNGAQNGIDTRRYYYARALDQGDAILPAPTTATVTGDDDMPRLVQDTTTKRRYLLVGGAPPRYVSKFGAKAAALVYGLPVTPHPVGHDYLVELDRNLRHAKGVIK